MKWDITLYDTNIDQNEIDAVKRVIQSKWISMGSETKAFEQEFSIKLGRSGWQAVAVHSGTAALHTALHALGIGPGDEVLVPSMTFVASAASILMVGAKPVFMDSTSLEDFSLNPDEINNKITARTKAIIVVHYGGYSADMRRIMSLARKYQLKVIEDVAHGPFISTSDGTLGTLGDIGCFSFFATKNLTTAEGGMIVSNDENILERCRNFRSHYMGVDSFSKHHGRVSTYDVTGVGMNYRMTDLNASIGRVQLCKWNRQQEKREELITHYRQLLQRIEHILLPYAKVPKSESSHHILPILTPSENVRNELIAYLSSQNIQSSVHYPPCHLFSYYRENFQTNKGQLPIAEEIGRRQITLPLHPNLSITDVNSVCEHLTNFFSKVKRWM